MLLFEGVSSWLCPRHIQTHNFGAFGLVVAVKLTALKS